MVGSERFDYLVLCNTALEDVDFWNSSLSYDNLEQCAGACSLADSDFDYPVCKGVTFTGANNGTADNCYLKQSADRSFHAPGIDSALLQRILLGVTNDTDPGTSTESAPFSDQTQTQDSSAISASMSSLLSDSSFSMPIITPAPTVHPSGMMVQAPYTAYSTDVSAGSTYSSGTGYTFSTMYANGSWVAGYYTSYTEVWSSATTVYGVSATGVSVVNSTNSNTEQQSSGDGGYETITTTFTNTTGNGWNNATEVQDYNFYNSSGSLTSSSATTYYYSEQTGAVANGGAAGGASGGVTSGGPNVTSTAYSTQTVISNSGAAAGAGSGVASGSPPTTSTSQTVVVNSYGTAYSSGYITSGNAGATGGGSGNITSGGPTGTVISVVTVISGSPMGTGYAASGIMSGGPGGTGGASSGIISGGPTNASLIGAVGGTATGTGYATSGISSGAPTNTTEMPGFSNTDLPRNGQYSTSPPIYNHTGGYYTGGIPPTSPISSGIGPLPTYNSSSGGYVAPTSPASSGTLPTPANSTGPLPTGPSPYPSYSYPVSPVGGSISSSPTGNTTTPKPTGTSPSYSYPVSPIGGTISPSPSGNITTPVPTGTAPVSAIPSMTSNCWNGTMGTTTVFSTVTVLGCASTCWPQPAGGYGPYEPYGGPQSFGPPVVATSTSTT